MPAAKPEKQFHFTKAALAAIKPPESVRFVEVFDDEVKELGCRIMASGTMTMFVDKKVRGHHVKHTLGRFIPGAAPKVTDKKRILGSVDAFRKEARAELVKMDDDPKKWLLGEQVQDVDSITISDAFDKALKVAKRGDLARRDWDVAKNRFIDWLKANHPRLKLWVDLRRQVVTDYMESRASVSANRQRLDMQPILQTSKYMATKFEIPDKAAGIELSNQLKRPTEAIYLQDVLGFLDWLKERGEAYVEAGVALAALAGLRMFEVLALRWSMVDLDRGLIETGTKNKYSHRVIPLAGRVVEALKRASEVIRPAKDVIDPDGGPVVATPVGGAPYDRGTDSWHNYAKLVRAALRDYCAHLNDERAKGGSKAKINLKWQVKNFRNVLPTLAELRGFRSSALEAYLGHSAKDVTGKHYVPRLAAGSIGEATELDRVMEMFRRLVVSNIEIEIVAIQTGATGAVINVKPVRATEFKAEVDA